MDFAFNQSHRLDALSGSNGRTMVSVRRAA